MISDNEAVVVYTDLPWVRMAEQDFQQIFQILIQNAIQYRKPGVSPRIEITAQPKGAEWIFSVQDNGIGIPAEYRQQIFGVFRRLHGPSRYGSTGMGLAICQKIVEHHGGSIWVESQPEAGSTFHFSVPALTTMETASRQYGSKT
jgi:signal transduction histidine kinase